jgi:hypothetical protein
MAVWLWYATDTPREHPRISAAERDYIEANVTPRLTTPLPLRLVLTNIPLLVIAFSYMCYAYIGWLFLFWFPTYLVEARGLPLGVMGMIGILLHGGGFLGLVGGGTLADWLLRRGWSAQFARVRFPGIGLALSLPCLLSAALVPSVTLCIVLLFLFYVLFVTALSGYSTVAVDFNAQLAGAIFGVINTLGTFAGFFGPLTAGYMLAGGGSWLLPFFVATAVGVVSAAILFFVPIRPIKLDAFAPAPVAVQQMVH